MTEPADAGLVPWDDVALEARCWACGVANPLGADRCRRCDRRDWAGMRSRVRERVGGLTSAWRDWDDRGPLASDYIPEEPGVRFGITEVMGLVVLVALVLTVGRSSLLFAGFLGFWGVPLLLTWHRAGRRRRELRPMSFGDLVADFATMVALILGVLLALGLLAGILAGWLYYAGILR